MTPIRQILEKHSMLLADCLRGISDHKFDAIEKEIYGLNTGDIGSKYVNYLPKESTDFTINISGDPEIISKSEFKDSENKSEKLIRLEIINETFTKHGVIAFKDVICAVEEAMKLYKEIK